MKRTPALLATLCVVSCFAIAGESAKNPATTSPPTPAADPFADRLTGDWGGLRSDLAAHGLTLDVESTHFYQGLLGGTGNKDFDYGGRVDAFFNVDTGKLGLWEGGGIRTHVEYRYGELGGSRGGALWPTNSSSVLPLGVEDELVATSIYLTQKLGDSASLMLGKINAVDLLANDAFFGGWGTTRFSNLAFVAPPSGVLPPVIYGAIASIKTDPITWTLMVYDPIDRTNEYWPDDLFDSGVNYALSATYVGKLAGRTTIYSLGGAYSTKDGANLSELLLPSDLKTGTKDGAYSVSFQFSHFLKEYSARPGDGWGLFLKGAIADGNPNPIQSSIVGGLGGKGLIPSRKDDSFGLGYFYYNFSNDLQSALSPLVKLKDEQGVEIFYNVAVTPWFHITADLQVIDPARSGSDTAVVGGLRANIRF